MPQSYLDYAASAPLDPRVAAVMLDAAKLTGNPGSVHAHGRAARAAVDAARTSVARLLDVSPDAVIFTSGATEANAMALFGGWKGGRMLVGGIEHASVWENARLISSRHGADVDVLPAGKDGRVAADPAALAAAIQPKTTLVSLQWVNNVLGTVQPVEAVGAAVKAERARRGVAGPAITFHCDAVQALATLSVKPAEAGIDLLSLSGHKIGGPKGVGALVRVTREAQVWPVYAGGGQEGGLRSGTENVSAIAGLGAAADILLAEREEEGVRLERLRAAFEEELKAACKDAVIVGGGGQGGVADGTCRVPHIVFVMRRSVPGDRLMLLLDASGFSVSAGSACDAGARRASRALGAVLDQKAALHGGVRVSFGRGTDEGNVRACARAIGSAR